jgi:hypothetical protein
MPTPDAPPPIQGDAEPLPEGVTVDGAESTPEVAVATEAPDAPAGVATETEATE